MRTVVVTMIGITQTNHPLRQIFSINNLHTNTRTISNNFNLTLPIITTTRHAKHFINYFHTYTNTN